jgi:putative thiamine transport system substrate-binding protein
MIARILALLLLLAGPAASGLSASARADEWDTTLARARGQTVFFNAWAGDEAGNAFIAWAGEQVEQRYGITLRHVRLRDTAEAVARVVAERAAGRNEGGAVDMIWINGPNFLAMKEQNLLYQFADRLPNFRLVDVEGKPATVVDFTVPVEGYASPWRIAQIVYVYDSARLPNPPRSIAAMLDWSRAHPGRLTHPQVRNFLGSTFLKQALYELVADPAVLQRSATDENFATVTAPLWAWYDALRPTLWHQGRQFPESGPAMRTLLNDAEIDIMISFNPSEAQLAVSRNLLPPSVRAYVLARGTIGNASFVSIPYNAAHRDAAMVVANFLLSPEAQARAQDPQVLGAFTVLDLARLTAEDRARFAAIPRGPASLTSADLGHPLLEPHPSWMTRITEEWERRYGSGQ